MLNINEKQMPVVKKKTKTMTMPLVKKEAKNMTQVLCDPDSTVDCKLCTYRDPTKPRCLGICRSTGNPCNRHVHNYDKFKGYCFQHRWQRKGHTLEADPKKGKVERQHALYYHIPYKKLQKMIKNHPRYSKQDIALNRKKIELIKWLHDHR